MSYRQAARWYDTIYGFKDYAAEAEAVRTLAAERRPGARRLLDVACGTGEHLRHLRTSFEVEGIDVSPDMLAIAREKLPDVPLHQADMRRFDLGRTFDAAICMFSAIGHLTDEAELGAAIACIARHLEPGGVFVLEPWLTPEAYHAGGVHALFVDEAEVKLARINVSRLSGRTSIMDMHHLVGTPGGVEHFVEHLELTLFPLESYRAALAAAGMTVESIPPARWDAAFSSASHPRRRAAASDGTCEPRPIPAPHASVDETSSVERGGRESDGRPWMKARVGGRGP